MGAKFKSNSTWNAVLEKMKRSSAGGNACRTTLLKSIISNLPMYFLSLFPIPEDAALHIKRLQCDFLWRGLGEESKFHLVNWDSVCHIRMVGWLLGRSDYSMKPY